MLFQARPSENASRHAAPARSRKRARWFQTAQASQSPCGIRISDRYNAATASSMANKKISCAARSRVKRECDDPPVSAPAREFARAPPGGRGARHPRPIARAQKRMASNPM
jgi:hypothetical protein